MAANHSTVWQTASLTAILASLQHDVHTVAEENRIAWGKERDDQEPFLVLSVPTRVNPWQRSSSPAPHP